MSNNHHHCINNSTVLLRTTRCYYAEFDLRKGATLTHVGHVIHGQNGLELCVQDAYGQESPYVHHGIEEWMLPEGSHHRNKDSTLFYLNRDKVPGALFDGKDETALNEEEKLDINKYFLYGVSFSKTMRSGDTERNARMEAVSLVSPSPLIELCRPFMEASLDLMMTPGKEAADHLDFATILSSVLMLAVVVANYSHTLSDNERSFLRCQLRYFTEDYLDGNRFVHQLSAEDTVKSLISLVDDLAMSLCSTKDKLTESINKLFQQSGLVMLKIPKHLDTHSGVSPSLSTLFQNTAQNDLVAIYLAVLFGKNVVVFGSKEISSDVLCRISSGISSLISSSIKSALCRNYPYASLHDSSALQTKGTVLATTNPMMLSMDGDIDLIVLCDSQREVVDNLQYKIRISSAKDLRGGATRKNNSDELSSEELNNIISPWLKLGVENRLSKYCSLDSETLGESSSNAMKSIIPRRVDSFMHILRSDCSRDELKLRLRMEDLTWVVLSRSLCHHSLFCALGNGWVSGEAFEETLLSCSSDTVTVYDELLSSEDFFLAVQRSELFAEFHQSIVCAMETQELPSIASTCARCLAAPLLWEYKNMVNEIVPELCLLSGLLPLPVSTSSWAVVYERLYEFLGSFPEAFKCFLHTMLFLGMNYDSISPGLLHQDEATRDRCRKLLERIDALCDTEDLTLNSQLSPAFLLLLRSSGDAS